MPVLDVAIGMRILRISMPARLADVGTAGIDARSRKHTLVKRPVSYTHLDVYKRQGVVDVLLDLVRL